MVFNIKRFLVILLFFSISLVSFGVDPGVPDPPPCPVPGKDPTNGPIEDGVPVIIGLALIYGAFKLQQTRRKLKEMEKEV